MIVDDHPVVREGLRQLIDHEAALMVCGEAEDAAATLSSVDRLNPDLIILDLSLKGGSGLDLLDQLQSRYPSLPVLVLSMHDEALYAERVLRAGARGYIMKHEATGTVITAIRRVLEGRVYLSDRASDRLLQNMVGAPEGPAFSIKRLSGREFEVFRLFGKGHTTREIAEQLNVSMKTIDTHRERIKVKLNLRTTAELVQASVVFFKDTAGPDVWSSE